MGKNLPATDRELLRVLRYGYVAFAIAVVGLPLSVAALIIAIVR